MKLFVLTILTLVYVWEMALIVLSMRSEKHAVPVNVADVYDRDTYLSWRRYHHEKSRLSLAFTTALYAVNVILEEGNLYSAFARLFPDTLFLQMFAVLLLSALSDLLLLPFAYYRTMRLEEKYGFNRSSKKTFWTDHAKEFLLGLLLMTFVGVLLIWLHRSLGDEMVPVFAAVMMLLALFVSFLYPEISRLFNRFTPLEEGELKDRLTALLQKHGYRVRAIQVMDASRRTTRSNAYFSGFGKMKTIVLYDTMLQQMTPDEICAVFAHELGHGLHHDTLRNQALSFLPMLAVGALAWLILKPAELYTAFGFDRVNYGFALVLTMGEGVAFFFPLFGLVNNWFSRRAEYRADAQAVQEGFADALVSALKKLARENYSDLAPHPLLVLLEYSHPPLSQRIEAIEKLKASL